MERPLFPPHADLQTKARQRTSRRRVVASLASLPAVAALLAACGGDTPQAQSGGTPAASAPRPTGAATSASGVSQALTVEPTRTALPAAQPSPTPVPYNPLTGELVADMSKVRRRIVGVKVDNAPLARPQFGLSQSDVVYEELAEGGLTRFLVFFLQNEPERIGPVRSARLTDIYLGQEWDFLLAYAGAGKTTTKLLADSLVPAFKAPELGEKLDGTPYFRDANRPIPHNMFVHVDQVRAQAAQDPQIPKEVEIRPFPFMPPSDTGSVRSVTMPYIPDAAVRWTYDEVSATWKRVMAGAPHVDALNNQQLTTTNVVIQYAEIFTAQNVEPDSAGNPVLDTVLRGTNKLRVFHSGKMLEGTWTKEHDRAKTQYKLDDGSPMPFRPGRIWIHIVPTDYQASWA